MILVIPFTGKGTLNLTIKKSSNKAKKKLGIDSPTKARLVKILSPIVYLWVAEYMPTGIDTPQASIIAATDKIKVLSTLVPIIWVTGTLKVKDSPKLP
jgi:hypothetical protein